MFRHTSTSAGLLQFRYAVILFHFTKHIYLFSYFLIFDVYEGKGIDPKRKSLGLGLTFRDASRTLSDDDVNQAVNQVIDSLAKNYKAELRS